jgi:hypothetical protein
MVSLDRSNIETYRHMIHGLMSPSPKIKVDRDSRSVIRPYGIRARYQEPSKIRLLPQEVASQIKPTLMPSDV